MSRDNGDRRRRSRCDNPDRHAEQVLKVARGLRDRQVTGREGERRLDDLARVYRHREGDRGS